MPLDPAMRVSDVERERVVAALAEHHAAGRLSLTELEERAGAAYRAVTGADLHRLLADLPRLDTTHSDARRDVRIPNSAWTTWAVTALICLVIWAATSVTHGAMTYFWPAWVIGPWALTLARPGMGGCRRTSGP